MTLEVVDMSFERGSLAMSGLGAGAQGLIKNIIDESNSSDIATPGGKGSKDKFFNHGYDKDPLYQGRSSPGPGVTVSVYYMPANKWEYDNYEVIDKAVGMLSGRRRLAVRINEQGKVAFYSTGHPKNETPGLRTNVYTGFTPIDTRK
jgi:hypothetical protein